jgi:hypothetical protein
MSHLIAFDVEMTGTDPFRHHMPDLGATMYRLHDGEKIDDFSVIINMPSDMVWSDVTIRNFWMCKVSPLYYETLRHKVENGEGVDMGVAMSQFVTFLQKCWDYTKGDLVMGSNRLDQDAFWVSHYLCKNGHPPLTQIFGKDMRLVDLNSYHQGASLTLHSRIKEFEKQGCGFDCSEAAFRYFNIAKRPQTPKTHEALQDAENVAQAHCLITSAIQRVLTPQTVPIVKWPPIGVNKFYY